MTPGEETDESSHSGLEGQNNEEITEQNHLSALSQEVANLMAKYHGRPTIPVKTADGSVFDPGIVLNSPDITLHDHGPTSMAVHDKRKLDGLGRGNAVFIVDDNSLKLDVAIQTDEQTLQYHETDIQKVEDGNESARYDPYKDSQTTYYFYPGKGIAKTVVVPKAPEDHRRDLEEGRRYGAKVVESPMSFPKEYEFVGMELSRLIKALQSSLKTE